MIEALVWSIAFVVMIVVMTGGVILGLHIIESGRTNREMEQKRNERLGMENMFNIKSRELDIQQEQIEMKRLQYEATHSLGTGVPVDDKRFVMRDPLAMYEEEVGN